MAMLFIAWALIWFGIGSHARKDYLFKQQSYKDMFPDIDNQVLHKAFTSYYFQDMQNALYSLCQCHSVVCDRLCKRVFYHNRFCSYSTIAIFINYLFLVLQKPQTHIKDFQKLNKNGE